MNTPSYLALPRLHAELFPHIEGCLTLWPGLPGQPEALQALFVCKSLAYQTG